MATSWTSWFSRRLRRTPSRCSRSDSPALPLISLTWATTPVRSPYCWIHLAAVLGPTPGTPGRLSEDSPTSAARSLYRCGGGPSFVSSASGHARQIVGGLTDERREVAVQMWREAVFRLHCRRGHPGQLGDPLDRVENGHLVVDQLKRVTVT